MLKFFSVGKVGRKAHKKHLTEAQEKEIAPLQNSYEALEKEFQEKSASLRKLKSQLAEEVVALKLIRVCKNEAKLKFLSKKKIYLSEG